MLQTLIEKEGNQGIMTDLKLYKMVGRFEGPELIVAQIEMGDLRPYIRDLI